jgi:hypothetical protein
MRVAALITASLALLVAAGLVTPSQVAAGEPVAVTIVTEDLDRFWRVMDHPDPTTLAERLQRDYIDAGSPGLAGFVPGRIRSGEHLAAVIRKHPRYYAALRGVTARMHEELPAVRRALGRVTEIHPEGRPGTVYLVIGALNSGGTTTDTDVIIGVEMYGRTEATDLEELSPWLRQVLAPAERLPAIVTHELVHTLQRSPSPTTLLGMALHEGSADFIGELLAGQQINAHIHDWARGRERDLWARFRREMNGRDATSWLYDGGRPREDGRPADVGYWMGYQITRAYYERARDKRAAIREILDIRNPRAFLRRSGYERRLRGAQR